MKKVYLVLLIVLLILLVAGLYLLNGPEKWVFRTNAHIASSPAVGPDGTIYLMDQNYFYAINSDGTEKWKLSKSAGDGSILMDVDGTIYVRTNNIYAIKPDGTVKWEFKTVGSLTTDILRGTNGTIYFKDNNYCYIINPDGSEKLKFKTGVNSYYSDITIGKDETVYVGINNMEIDSYVYAIRLDGTLKWKFKADTPGKYDSVNLTIGDDGTLYFWNGKYLYAIDQDGNLKWTKICGPNLTLGNDGTLYVFADKFYALNPDGSEKWMLELERFFNQIPTIMPDGTIYVVDDNLKAINPNGSVKWEVLQKIEHRLQPTIGHDGIIYVGSQYSDNPFSYLYAINPDGNEIGRVKLERIISSPPTFGLDGTIYVVSDSGYTNSPSYLHALKDISKRANEKRIIISIFGILIILVLLAGIYSWKKKENMENGHHKESNFNNKKFQEEAFRREQQNRQKEEKEKYERKRAQEEKYRHDEAKHREEEAKRKSYEEQKKKYYSYTAPNKINDFPSSILSLLQRYEVDTSSKVTLETIKKKRKYWLELLHPDMNVNKSDETRKMGEEKLKEMNEIYKQLKDYFMNISDN